MKLLRTLIAFVLLCAYTTSHSAGIDFLPKKTWKEILARAKEENKIVFLDAYASWCGPCKYMQSRVFTDAEVGNYFNSNFINVKMDMEEGEGPELAEKFGLGSYPTLYFIDGDGKILHKKVGSMEASELLQLGVDAIDPSRQFYTIRENAMSGTVEAATFHKWIHEASEMDEDIDSVVISYLATTKNSRMEKDMLEIMLDHGPLNKEQIDFLFKNKEACLKLIKRTQAQFISSMQLSVTVYASNESLIGDELNFVKMQQIIGGYFPADASLMTKKVKIRYLAYKEEYKACLDLLAECITSPALKLKADDLSKLVTANIKIITEQERVDDFIKKVSAYKLLPGETTKAYQPNLCLLVLYYCKDDKAKMKLYSDKILKDANAPREIKSQVKDVMEEAKGK
jgi:thiol-disulfide isomerase/thioredoxin